MDEQKFPLHPGQEESSESSPGVREFGPYRLVGDRYELWKEGTLIPLNTQEGHLLWYLASHPGRILDRSEILEQVWGYGTGTTTRTVDVHVAKLRHRLEESERPNHIQTVRGRGYRFQL
jgi:two-component system alkaline phosphatase synthesis response regulator PhoP